MFKILSLIVLSWMAYRLFLAPQKQIPDRNAQTGTDEFIEYEDITDEEQN